MPRTVFRLNNKPYNNRRSKDRLNRNKPMRKPVREQGICATDVPNNPQRDKHFTNKSY